MIKAILFVIILCVLLEVVAFLGLPPGFCVGALLATIILVRKI